MSSRYTPTQRFSLAVERGVKRAAQDLHLGLILQAIAAAIIEMLAGLWNLVSGLKNALIPKGAIGGAPEADAVAAGAQRAAGKLDGLERDLASRLEAKAAKPARRPVDVVMRAARIMSRGKSLDFDDVYTLPPDVCGWVLTWTPRDVQRILTTPEDELVDHISGKCRHPGLPRILNAAELRESEIERRKLRDKERESDPDYAYDAPAPTPSWG